MNEHATSRACITIDNFTTFFRLLFIGRHGRGHRRLARVHRAPRQPRGRVLRAAAALHRRRHLSWPPRATCSPPTSPSRCSRSRSTSPSRWRRTTRRSGEATLKYVLLGGVASAMLLYGLSLLYGVAGSTQYTRDRRGAPGRRGDLQMPLLLGLVFIIAGLGFKASAVPFHMWTPDAYEGAPIPVTAYLSATSKAATFALFLRWFAGPLLPAIEDWQWMIADRRHADDGLGNLVALQQSNIKRLMAYSSIGQVGFMLMAASRDRRSTRVHLASAARAPRRLPAHQPRGLHRHHALLQPHRQGEISDFKGLAETNPYLALVITAGSSRSPACRCSSASSRSSSSSRRSSRRLPLADVRRRHRQHGLALLLPAGHQADVPVRAARATQRWRISPTGYLVTGVLFVAVVVLGVWGAPLYQVADAAASCPRSR
jgi:hypothetical protein